MDDRAYASTAMATQDRSSLATDLDAEVTRLTDVITRVEDRLSVILEPDYGSAEKNSEVPAPIQSYLRSTTNSLSRQINRLVAILDRVEV